MFGQPPFLREIPKEENEPLANQMAEKAKLAAQRAKIKFQAQEAAGLTTLGPELEVTLWELYNEEAELLIPGSTATPIDPAEKTNKQQETVAENISRGYIPADYREFKVTSPKQHEDYENYVGQYALALKEDMMSVGMTEEVKLLSDVRAALSEGRLKVKDRTLAELTKVLIVAERSMIQQLMKMHDYLYRLRDDPRTSTKMRRDALDLLEPEDTHIQEIKQTIAGIKQNNLPVIMDALQKHIRLGLAELRALTGAGRDFAIAMGVKVDVVDPVDDPIIEGYFTEIAQWISDLDKIRNLEKAND